MIRLASVALLLLLASPAGAATVLSVGDGDTLRVVDDGKRLTIRMACIDAPETAQGPYGAASRQRLQELAPVGSVVTLRPQTIDKYGRTVAEVFRISQSVNLAMVSSGQAFAYRKYLAACDGSAYLGAEAAAQRQRVGVWAVPGGIQRPWDWRHGPRRATSLRPNTPRTHLPRQKRRRNRLQVVQALTACKPPCHPVPNHVGMTKAPRPNLQQTAQQTALLADALRTQRPFLTPPRRSRRPTSS